jgi:hypothetical protein
MKLSNRQITMIPSAANPFEFKGIGERTRNANHVFEKGDSSRVWRDRFRASGTHRVKAGALINNFIPDEGIERMGTGIRDMIRRCRKAGLAEPEIRLDAGFFVLTIQRKTPEPGDQVGTRSGPGHPARYPASHPASQGAARRHRRCPALSRGASGSRWHQGPGALPQGLSRTASHRRLDRTNHSRQADKSPPEIPAYRKRPQIAETSKQGKR